MSNSHATCASRLILASASPRRRDLLSTAGYVFDVRAADIEEIIDESVGAVIETCRLAIEKAEAVLCEAGAGAVVLAADTTVVIDNRVFGKPRDAADARRMLGDLAGRTHRVITGWALLSDDPAAATCGYSQSWVRMRELGRAEIAAYVAGGEPLDKAGSYALQGDGGRVVAGVIGSYRNVIGLPVEQVGAALARFGIEPSDRGDGQSSENLPATGRRVAAER